MKRQKGTNHYLIGRQNGSMTLFLALILTLVFSLFFSLLEAARVQGISQIARRSLLLELESAFGEYQVDLWENYRLLFLDGSNQAGELDLALLENRRMQEASLEQKGAGFYQMALKNLEVTKYSLASDHGGAAFEKQACLAIQKQLAAGAAEALKQKIAEGKEMAQEGESLEGQWDSAKNAMMEAKDYKEEAQGGNPTVSGTSKEQETGNMSLSEENRPGSAGNTEKELPKNPVESVDMLKKSAILAVVVENPSEISGKEIPIRDTLKRRVKCEGSMGTPKCKNLDKIWFLQYIDHFFACKTGRGKEGSEEHALDYELEYCVAGKGSDHKNLEKTVKELLLIREAGNFTTIMQDAKKCALALEIATAAVGFTGIPPLIQAVQIGILLAWSYIESILDVRCLLSGGSVPLVKKVTQWKSDVSLGEQMIEEKAEKTESQKEGLNYREYLQILLLLVREETLVYRAMDIVERNIGLKDPVFRMDHQLHGVQMEGLYSAKPLFLAFMPYGTVKDGDYHFYESYSYSYLK